MKTKSVPVVKNESESSSESSSESDTSSLENKLRRLKIPSNVSKKIKINPFIGGLSSVSYIETITKYLDNYKVGTLNPIKGILIRGNIGSGKITLLKACIKKSGYLNIMYDADSDTEDIFDNLLLTIEAKGFYKLMQQKGTSKRVITIRDLEGALKPTDKSNFFKFINKSKNTIPILMTSTDRTIGSSREIPKCILQLEFENPSTAELVKHFNCDKISKNALEKIISDSKFDLRYIHGIINGLEHSKIKMNINKVLSFAKDIELDTFSCIKYCTDPTKTWDQKLVHTSLYTNSTLFHNYPSIIKQITGKSDDMEICSKIADICCESEIIINYAFGNQCWDLLDDYYNTIGTIGPVELMNKRGLCFDKLAYPSSNLTVYKDEDVDFALIEKESMILKIILLKYFNGNKFIGNSNDFKKEMKMFKYPIRAYKLANITNNQKKVNTFIKELKKRIVIDDD
jgi:hypothetical protein